MYRMEAGDGTLLQALREQGVLLEAPCNGKHVCGKCKLRIRSGQVSPMTDEEAAFLTPEEKAEGIRLACFAYAYDTVEAEAVMNREERKDTILMDGYFPEITWEPGLRFRKFSPLRPDLKQQLSLWECVARPLGTENQKPPLSLLRKLPALLDHEELTAVFRGDTLISISPAYEGFSLAVDIGTTTVACSLVDMVNGRIIAEDAFLNPQKSFGLDVLSRMQYSMENENGSVLLQQVLVEELNASLERLRNRGKVPADAVYEAMIAGNVTMIHSLLSLPMTSLGMSPYVCVYRQMASFPAKEIGLELNSEGIVSCIPAVSTYIGGDIVSGILLTELDQTKENILFIDIGTNGEMVLSRGGEMLSCSCAAGPALEGMNISCGMRADDGAIGEAAYRDGKFELTVIGGGEPKGLCGSGILDAVCAGLKCGAIESSGRLSKNHPLVSSDGTKRLILSEKYNIGLTQKDIRQIQLCKGAILSGVLTLLHHAGIREEDLDRVLVAGQFGRHLTPESLVGAGLIPVSLRDKIRYIGNSAHMGAVACLHSEKKRRLAGSIAGAVSYIELSALDGYEATFSKALSFGDDL